MDSWQDDLFQTIEKIMNYTVIDPNTNIIVNIIVYDGFSEYDPSPFVIRPFKEGDAIGSVASESE
jgi:hypothetical protein